MKKRCFTAYIKGYRISFTEYTENQAKESAIRWLIENEYKYENTDIYVEETTDKFISEDENYEFCEVD